MDKILLNTEIQEFINSNLDSDPSQLILKGIPFDYIDPKLVIEQIEAKKRSQKKLPTWYNAKNIYYPNKLNIEQTSSEVTAAYKSSLISGRSIIDITGGFGVDAYYFSKRFESVIHCETNTKLSTLAEHNFEALNVSNITCVNENGEEALTQTGQSLDWIYVDPSRRDDTKQKVFLLTDCEPNILDLQDKFLNYAKNVLIKTSPLLDLSATYKVLKNVKEIHIIAVNNEVKELLWVIERNYMADAIVKTINLQNNTNQRFEFVLGNEPRIDVKYSKPLTYLYEPNAAILKSGGFNSISGILELLKLHKHSHLYTSDTLEEFPGRRFKIDRVLLFNKKAFLKLNITKANVTTRNFPLSVEAIRKKLKIHDGGNIYIFFTTDNTDAKIVIICTKLK